MLSYYSPCYLLLPPYDHTILSSFPTRRSSDLVCAPHPGRARGDDDQRFLARSCGPCDEFHARRRARGGSPDDGCRAGRSVEDRKSTRLNSSHLVISYAVFCLKKKRINLNDIKY